MKEDNSNRVRTAKCALGGEEDVRFVKSHIIPRSFYDDFANRPLKFVKLVDGIKKPDYRQSGVYEYFLCESCESGFSGWDTHAHRVLSAPFEESNVLEDGSYDIADADYKSLKLFFVSILWKASHASHPCFAAVDLGPYERIFRSMILSKEAGPADVYPVFLEKFTNVEPDDPIMFNVSLARLWGRKAYTVYLAQFRVTIVVDRRPISSNQDCFISPGNTPVFFTDFELSREFVVGSRIIALEERRRSNNTNTY